MRGFVAVAAIGARTQGGGCPARYRGQLADHDRGWDVPGQPDPGVPQGDDGPGVVPVSRLAR